MTEEAPAAKALVISPECLIPPSAMIGTPLPARTFAQSAIAVICGIPAPDTIRVVQIEPGPTPTFTASAPAFETNPSPLRQWQYSRLSVQAPDDAS